MWYKTHHHIPVEPVDCPWFSGLATCHAAEYAGAPSRQQTATSNKNVNLPPARRYAAGQPEPNLSLPNHDARVTMNHQGGQTRETQTHGYHHYHTLMTQGLAPVDKPFEQIGERCCSALSTSQVSRRHLRRVSLFSYRKKWCPRYT